MNDNTSQKHLSLAKRIADSFCVFPNVEGIALGGSQTSGGVDQFSDIDLYVFTTSVISVKDRGAIVEKLGSTRSDLNLQFWDPGDEWCDAETGIEVDVIYWDTAWIEGQLNRVLIEHQANVGYSTCFWHTIRSFIILYDRDCCLHKLKEQSMISYPEELRKAIIAKNYPVLREVIPSYLNQIKKAIDRKDLVSINHRLAALLASYFDVLFALNYLPNPGEKQMLITALERCEKVPRLMAHQVNGVVAALPSADFSLIEKIEDLIDGLEELLIEEGFG